MCHQREYSTRALTGTACLLSLASVVLAQSGCTIWPSSLEKNATGPSVKLAPANVATGEVLQASTQVPLNEIASGDSKPKEPQISNPLATEIRFDGQESVLGGGECESLPAATLRTGVELLLDKDRPRSAKTMVLVHRTSAEQLLFQSVAERDADCLDFIAETLDRNASQQAWIGLRNAARAEPTAASEYSELHAKCIAELAELAPPSEVTIERLKVAASKLASSAAKAEASRIEALKLLASQRPDLAAERFAQLATSCKKAGIAGMSARMWLLAADALLRCERVEGTRECWEQAIAAQLSYLTQRDAKDFPLPPIDTVFWAEAMKLKAPQDELPREIVLALSPWISRLGFAAGDLQSVEAAIWSAIAEFQLTTGQPHLAAVSLKRADVQSPAVVKPWLQIALAKAMAAQGQDTVATAVLQGNQSHADTAVQAASLATLGSIKIQAGAYEQGAQFLVKALNIDATQWPGQLNAEADLANARLILGNSETASDSLHKVQNRFALVGRWQALCQSLENEAAILEFEGHAEQAETLRARVQAIENEKG